jgi:hypothetical protein
MARMRTEATSAITAKLYDQDLVLWTEEQAKALRLAAQTRSNLLDWENLAEEVESLGRTQRTELSSRTTTIIEHLLKLEHSPATEPRRRWIETVLRERAHVEVLLEASPSLRRELPAVVAIELRRARKLTVAMLTQFDEADPAVVEAISAAEYAADQVLGDWLPQGPTAGRR